jgi:hypothetical protein
MSYKANLVRLVVFTVSLLWGAAGCAAQAATPARGGWELPAAELTGQIADTMGPGQARLTIRNQSTISTDEIPAIRKLLVADLKSHGVQVSGTESANAIRITLSENARERLWVAEVIQGSETRVTMVRVDAVAAPAAQASGGLALRRQMVAASKTAVLAAIETGGGVMLLEPEKLVFAPNGDARPIEKTLVEAGQRRQMTRDPRGLLMPTASGDAVDVYLPGEACRAEFPVIVAVEHWNVSCHESDDPWPMTSTMPAAGSADIPMPIKAFYSSARDTFTGVVTPGVGVDLPAFYSGALVARPAGAALMIDGVDGRVGLAENGRLRTIGGTRDWGSDFAVLHAGCNNTAYVIASGSGEAASDSLRAYDVAGLDAIAASAPLAMDGSVMAIWTAPGGASIYATVRHAGGDYEVDRVTALCD